MDGIGRMKREGMLRVTCPRCGYKMPVFYDGRAGSHGVFVPCKGRGCGAFFEIRIKDGGQVR